MPYPSTTIPDFTGQTIDDGRYRLIQKIGSGSYGVVYRALDLAAFKFIARPPIRAIKIVSKKSLCKRAAHALTREYNIHLGMGEHPNIVTLLRGFEDKDYAYFVLDYCPGGDLFHKAVREGFYWRKDDLLKKVFLQIIDALEACHLRSVSHRDLKPENILTNEDGSAAYLTDFGLSTNQATADSFGCGSAPYMSPECIGEECDYQAYSNPQSDIWSLGLTLLLLIGGRLPWAKAMTTDDNFHHFILDPDFLRKVLPISKGAHEIIIRMLELLPEKRISFAELRSAINNLDTFFMSEEEVASAHSAVRTVADYMYRKANKLPDVEERKVGHRRRALPKLAVNKFQIQRVGSGGQLVDVDLAKGIPPRLERVAGNNRTPHSVAPIAPAKARNPTSVDITSLVIPEVVRTASTDEDSIGPVTPETYPVVLEVEISEMEDDLGMAAFSSERENAKPRPLHVVNQIGPLVSQ